MTTIIAAVAAGLILLWAGILGLLKLVDLFERKHILSLGGFTTLVAGLVIGLVLFTVQERQKQHRRDMAKQIDAVTDQLSDLSNRMLAQLEEKAKLTGSEFEIRANLQHEQADHDRTRSDLARVEEEFDVLEQTLARARERHRDYQAQQNRNLEKRTQTEDERYGGIQELLGHHQRASQNMQKQLAAIQDDLSKLSVRTDKLQTQQNGLLGKVSAAKQVQDLNAQRIDALARSLQALHEDLSQTMVEVDSLYNWRK